MCGSEPLDLSPEQVMGLSQTTILSPFSPWLLVALWLHQSACGDFPPSFHPRLVFFYGEGSREGSCSTNSSLCLRVLFPSVVFYLATAPRQFCQLAPKEDGLRLGTCAHTGSAGTFQPHLSLGTDLPEGPVGEETY